MLQSNPDSIGKRGGDGGKREKTSLVREEYVMEREEKYVKKQKQNKQTKKKPEIQSVVATR